MINDFEFYLIKERLHVHKELDEYSDKIYDIIKKSDKIKFEFLNLPEKLNISKLIINIKDIKPNNGELDLNKSKKISNGWIIVINLKPDFKQYTLNHELNHALRLTLMGKEKMIKNLNYIKSKGIFSKLNNSEINKFFYFIYLSNDEEINARVSEINGYIKEIIRESNINLKKDDFIYIVKNSEAYRISEELINFNCKDNFKNFDKNQLNKFFYIFEENKNKLDKIYKSKIKLFFKILKDTFSNKIDFYSDDEYIYKPDKNCDFYNKWINNQGLKLRKRLFSLYDLYEDQF